MVPSADAKFRAVTAPGCKHFGTKVFEECCSPTQTGVTQCPGNTLALQAQFCGLVCFKDARLCITSTWASQSPVVLQIRTEVCLTAAAGIVALFLPWICPKTCVIELLGSTFAHCSQLQQLSLSRNLRIIKQEAFLKCTSLQEVCIPPSLLCFARQKGKAKHGEVPMSN